jgi:glycosyltransferase involved in cell wall biosynthesis
MSRVDELRPDVIVVAAPFRPSLCLLVRRDAPLVFFAEEDLSRLPSKGATRHISRQQTMTRLREPEVVVVIAERERRWAEQRWPRSKSVVIPHGIDVDHWAAPVRPIDDRPADAFAVGDFSHARNRAGLQAVVEEVERREADAGIVLGVASAKPFDRDEGWTRSHRIHEYGRIDDPRQGYAGSRVALVPSFQVTGVKTQILQAWAAGSPVVTTTAAAESVGALDGREVLAGANPGAVVDRLERVLADPQLADDLVTAGRRAVQAHFSLDALGAGVAEALACATGPSAP